MYMQNFKVIGQINVGEISIARFEESNKVKACNKLITRTRNCNNRSIRNKIPILHQTSGHKNTEIWKSYLQQVRYSTYEYEL